jgi:hypothetical protein
MAEAIVSKGLTLIRLVSSEFCDYSLTQSGKASKNGK